MAKALDSESEIKKESMLQPTCQPLRAFELSPYYKLEPPFISGGFGAIHICKFKQDIQLQPTNDEKQNDDLCSYRKVAKIVKVDDEIDVIAVFRESHVLTSKIHRNLVNGEIFKSQDNNNIIILVMDRYAASLADLLRNGASIGKNEAEYWSYSLLLAIYALHGLQISHRDIKPDNILFSGDGELLLADYGLSKVLLETDPNHTECGTDNYMAPEVKNTNNYSLLVDIYSFSIIVAELAGFPWSKTISNFQTQLKGQFAASQPKWMSALKKKISTGFIKPLNSSWLNNIFKDSFHYNATDRKSAEYMLSKYGDKKIENIKPKTEDIVRIGENQLMKWQKKRVKYQIKYEKEKRNKYKIYIKEQKKGKKEKDEKKDNDDIISVMDEHFQIYKNDNEYSVEYFSRESWTKNDVIEYNDNNVWRRVIVIKDLNTELQIDHFDKTKNCQAVIGRHSDKLRPTIDLKFNYSLMDGSYMEWRSDSSSPIKYTQQYVVEITEKFIEINDGRKFHRFENVDDKLINVRPVGWKIGQNVEVLAETVWTVTQINNFKDGYIYFTDDLGKKCPIFGSKSIRLANIKKLDEAQIIKLIKKYGLLEEEELIKYIDSVILKHKISGSKIIMMDINEWTKMFDSKDCSNEKINEYTLDIFQFLTDYNGSSEVSMML